MKLATLKNGARDGQLVVVSRDLSRHLAVPPSPPPCSRRSTTGLGSRHACKPNTRP